MINLEHYNPITGPVIQAAMEVHSWLGYGFLESVYHNALKIEFNNRGILFNSQETLDVFYKGHRVGHFIPDFLIDDVIVEIKAIENVNYKEIQKQVINYLVVSGLKVALMINFGKTELEFKRYVIPLKFQ